MDSFTFWGVVIGGTLAVEQRILAQGQNGFGPRVVYVSQRPTVGKFDLWRISSDAKSILLIVNQAAEV